VMAKKPKGFGSAPKKMAKGGSTKSGGGSQKQSVSVSKSSGKATTTKATGREAAGTKNVGTFTKSGGGGSDRSGSPGYRAMSVKGLTSSDPANVARNRAAAAQYASQRAGLSGSGDAKGGTNAQSRLLENFGFSGPVSPLNRLRRTPAPTVPPAPQRVYTPMPADYNPAVQGEWNFYQPRPTVTLAKGGKVKPKRKK
jgi:hypothetical protein